MSESAKKKMKLFSFMESTDSDQPAREDLALTMRQQFTKCMKTNVLHYGSERVTDRSMEAAC